MNSVFMKMLINILKNVIPCLYLSTLAANYNYCDKSGL